MGDKNRKIFRVRRNGHYDATAVEGLRKVRNQPRAAVGRVDDSHRASEDDIAEYRRSKDPKAGKESAK